ncbi:Gfo/Idh/MocA family oxidoreductase (plasmid) [Rhizobium sullae]|uniref:Gfo/Idh/MocA family oxidoreductase n=1 Tax=Rhizobium sullae TaxID=50338 RepID=A0ABY5XXF3_RHISU|nr:Gfo/Idh/MocA family oxidoreductase [Rhizobium sullae]UWU19322.1 Gfo/Idh/MocA family oxidoreductase [Rhizobium sullae]
MPSSIAVAVIGAGAIGRTHIDTIRSTPGVKLAGIVDPTADARSLADTNGVPYFPDTNALIAAKLADAAIVATPNELHLPVSEALLTAGLPVLLEKPVAESLVSALKLVSIVAATGVPLLVGHHRRHNPIVRTARAAIEAGDIGDLVMATVTSSLAKPAPYFQAEWRRKPGVGGPLLINLVHEIDQLRYFFGEISTVQSITSNSRRGFEVEDTAAVCLTFAGGGLATLCISDAAVGPWSWDLTANENPARFPAYDVPAHYYAGSRAGLSLPDLKLWKPRGTPDWTETLTSQHLPFAPAGTYVAQLEHFVDLVRMGGMPLVSAQDATANILVLDAIARAGASGQSVAVDLSPLTLSQDFKSEDRGHS